MREPRNRTPWPKALAETLIRSHLPNQQQAQGACYPRPSTGAQRQQLPEQMPRITMAINSRTTETRPHDRRLGDTRTAKAQPNPGRNQSSAQTKSLNQGATSSLNRS